MLRDGIHSTGQVEAEGTWAVADAVIGFSGNASTLSQFTAGPHGGKFLPTR